MPRGTPDGRIDTLSFAAQVTDTAYLGNVLWGFAPIDSKGRPYFLDSFNNGLGGWFASAFGAGAVPEIHTAYAWNGFIFSPPNAVKFAPGVVANDNSQIARTYFLGVNRRLGFEAVIAQWNNAPNFTFFLDYRIDNTVKYTAALRYNAAAANWQISTPSGWVSIFAQAVLPAGRVAHIPVKFVGDWETGKYVRALIGDSVIDLSTYSMPASTLPIDKFITATIVAESRGVGTGLGYVGYVILTKDEP